ncbi:NADPH-dependent F420 reductase [Marinicella sp. W31]|uniref:NADPH-dependent F420 reductase n=1 Tax=Marinicella sp. W31 TaxID=3023713 RepID=UPI003757BFF0
MKIGIIGAGSIGKLYASLWITAGHQVMLSSRHPEKIKQSPEFIDNTAIGTPAEAARFGETVLLAVNYESLDSAIASIQLDVNDKLVIDATNPLVWTENGNTTKVISDEDISVQRVSKRLSEARIAKAFTTLWTGYVEQYSNVNNPEIAMPFATDNQQDRITVSELIKDAGLIPVDLGKLSNSRPLDPPSPIWNVALNKKELIQRLNRFRNKFAV